MKEIIKNKKVWIVVALFLIAVVALAMSQNDMDVQTVPTDTETAANLEAQKTDIINKIKAITALPNENPVVYTVNDADLLKGQQPFFKDALNGDILLVFQTTGVALIFREAENRIINSGPISLDQPTATTTKTTTSTTPASTKTTPTKK